MRINSLWEVNTIIKHNNIYIIGIPKEKEREKGARNFLKEIMAESFPNLGKETYIQIQNAQKFSNKINPRRSISRHIIIKMAKGSDKERILKTARENS